MFQPASRLYTFIAILGLFALAVALFSQHGLGMRPCAWCVFQRLILIALVVTSVAASWLLRSASVRWGLLAGGLALLLSVGGMVAAWYQYTVAAMQFSCAQTFADRFMSQSGLDAALPWLFGIYATCMDARVNLLGLEYALWALGLFMLTALLCLLALWRHWRSRTDQALFG